MTGNYPSAWGLQIESPESVTGALSFRDNYDTLIRTSVFQILHDIIRSKGSSPVSATYTAEPPMNGINDSFFEMFSTSNGSLQLSASSANSMGSLSKYTPREVVIQHIYQGSNRFPDGRVYLDSTISLLKEALDKLERDGHIAQYSRGMIDFRVWTRSHELTIGVTVMSTTGITHSVRATYEERI